MDEATKRFGRIYGGFRTTTKMLFLNDAKLARELSTKYSHKFPVRNSLYAGSSNISKSLFFMEANEDWKRIRSIVTPAFTSGKLRRMISPMERISNNFIDHIRPYAKTGELIDMKRFIGGFTMDVIASCAYGIDIDSVRTPNHPVVVNAKKILNVDVSISFLFCIFFPGFAKFLRLEAFDKKAVEYFDDLTFEIVEKRLKSDEKQKPDLLGLMIENADLDQNHNPHLNESRLKGISKDEISGQGVIFFIAGFDTTHATFDHAIYYLAKYPEWQERLYNELVAESKNSFDFDRLKELPILNGIISETLRLNPPLTEFHRECKEECELCDTGLRLPKNTLVLISPYSIHRDPEYFPDPLKFDPERFFGENSQENNKAYMPFGAGPRLCVGMRFAQNELRIGLAKFILNYKVEIDPDFKLEYFNGSILLSPKRLMVRLSER
ncbi:hypothetical protein RDWZM_009492 [Blomia tropicalis]|uniref:Uncharacterized protein n=1 Tax=Blomia tropicalis TaxID=40697 RepID=A0A9Q0RLD2_BLOTA|nr:hypothetical protein RDWZM_009492 [Blomia tropicalis]